MIRIRNINNAIILFFKYIYLKLVFNNILKKCLVINKIRRQVYIINNLKINILIDFDILNFKKIILDFVIKFLIIDSYRNIITFIKIILLCEKMHKVVRAYDAIIVLFYFSIIILICLRDKCKTKLSKNCDFIFMLIELFNRFELDKDILNYIIDVNIYAI